MKKCTWCGKEHPNEADKCSVDQQPLVSSTPASENTSVPAANRRAERNKTNLRDIANHLSLKGLLTIIAWTAGAYVTTAFALAFAFTILGVFRFIFGGKSESEIQQLFMGLPGMWPIIMAAIVLVIGLRGRLPGMPQRNASDQQSTAPSRRGADSTYDLLADKVGFVPSLRKKDNLYQAASVGVFLIIGVTVGGAVRGWPEGALLGAIGGLIAGGLISGLVIMVLGLRRRS